jgi:lysozyme
MIEVPQAAIELAKRFEGFERKVKRGIEITAVPYICPAGFWTIGYGHLCDPKHPPITEAEAEVYLARDLQSALAPRCATARCWPPSRRAARGHRGLHVQPRRGAAADIDAAAADQPAGLGSAGQELRGGSMAAGKCCRGWLLVKTQEAAIAELSDLASSSNCALLCYEADFNFCHRSMVAEAVRDYCGADVEHIKPADSRTTSPASPRLAFA